MKKYILGLSLIIGLILGGVLLAQSQNIPQIQQWLLQGTTLVPRNASSSVRIPSLGAAGSPCVAVSSSGTLSTVACGGAVATTTINNVSGPTFVFNSPSSTLRISTSTGTLGFDLTTLNISQFANNSNYLTAAITSLNGSTSSTQTFSTSSETNLGLNITTSNGAHTFAPVWIGTLANNRIASSTYWNEKQDALGYTPLDIAGSNWMTSALIVGGSATSTITGDSTDSTIGGALTVTNALNIGGNLVIHANQALSLEDTQIVYISYDVANDN